MRIEIPLHPSLKKPVTTGLRETIILSGKKMFPIGPAVFVTTDEVKDEIPIRIRDFEHLLIKELTHFDARAEGSDNTLELRQSIMRDDPELTPSSVVTLLHFTFIGA